MHPPLVLYHSVIDAEVTSRGVALSEIPLAHVNEWPQFIQRVIVCVIVTWHPGGVIEVNVPTELQSAPVALLTVFLDFQGKDQ